MNLLVDKAGAGLEYPLVKCCEGLDKIIDDELRVKYIFTHFPEISISSSPGPVSFLHTGGNPVRRLVWPGLTACHHNYGS